MNTINAIWHKANRMPNNPTVEQRLHWHLEHQKHCTCRPMPEKLKAEARLLNIK